MEEICESLPHDLDGLVQKLSDQDPDVRRLAAMRLMSLDDDRAVEPLIRALEDESPHVRASAALAIGHYTPLTAVPALLDHLRHDPYWHARAVCAVALGWIGGDEAINALIPALQDPDRQVRSAAVSVFARNKDRRAIDNLIQLLDDPEWTVRYAVCDAMVMLGVGGEPVVNAILKLRELPEAREFAQMTGASDILMEVFEHHPEGLDWTHEYAMSNPEAAQRDFLDMLRERLGEEAVPRPPDDPLADLADRAHRLPGDADG
jgi:HEAT repeat protein